MDQVAQVRERIDIVSLLSEYITLKKSGRNFKAICPFHNEKSPSFMVSPERQIWHCFGCFPPGEKIKTPFGFHPIEEIDENHWVVSGKGNIRKVLKVMQHQYKGDLVKVRTRKLGGEVKLTSDHNVFVIRGAPYLHKNYKNFSRRYNRYLNVREVDKNKYQKLVDKYFPIKTMPAGELRKGDLLLYPINRQITDVPTIDLSVYRTKSTHLGPVPKNIPLLLPVTEDLLKLLGYWIAEGSSHRAYIRFSLGNHEEVFAQEIVALIKKLFGLEASIYRRTSSIKSGIEITACHAALANIFENLCGKGAANKHIPFVFQELPIEKQQIILSAIHKGDGTTFIPHRSQKEHKSITTISRVLAEQLVDIVLRLRIFPSLHIEKTKEDKKGVNHKEAYSVFWSEQSLQRYNLIYYHSDGSESWLLPITQINAEPYDGLVYNFTVDTDHSYVATNFAVANCGKGGDAFTFLMEYEHAEFPEALRILAKRTGVELISTSYDSTTSSKKEQIYKLNLLAAEFYHYVLTSHPAGKAALAYLKGRQVDEKIITSFKLGFAPSSGTSLVKYLTQRKKYTPEDILDAGLATRHGVRLVDFFRGRVIFPLVDHRDNVIGFAGRILTPSETSPKYINTRETLVYHKGEVVYGLNMTKDAIRRSNQAILVEGEFDAISCFQNGVGNVVAVKGTALTEHQVALLGRYAQKLTVCFDGDSAGQEAIKRSLPIIEKKGLTTTVIVIPEGKDPDEALKTNPAAFKQAVKHEVGIYDFLLESALKKYDRATPDGKKQIAAELLPVISSITNEIVKEHYLRKVSGELATSYESIVKELTRHSLPKPRLKETASQPKTKLSREEILEEYLVSLIVQYPSPRIALHTAVHVLSETMSRERAYQKIIYHLREYLKADTEFNSQVFAEKLPPELSPAYDKSLLFPLPQFETPEKHQAEIVKTAEQLRTLYVKQKIKLVIEEIEAKEQAGQEEAVTELKADYSRLVTLLSKAPPAVSSGAKV